MRLSHLLLTAAALATVAAPTLAGSANPAASLSLADDPAGGGDAGGASHRHSAVSTPIILLGVVGVGAVAAALAMSHSDNKPASA